MKLDAQQLDAANLEFSHEPVKLIEWANGLGVPMLTATNFGPFSAVLLHMVTRVSPKIPVLWVDTGYSTKATYRYADEVTQLLGLNLHIYHPRRSLAHREAVEGALPTIDDPRHPAFTDEVKLEPFARATADLAPQLWFAGVRAEQTDLRATMQPVSVKDDLIKVAPVLHWSSKQMNDYLKQHGLPNNFDYFDPTKVEDKRECGLHVAF